jgi:homoserine kinase
VTVERADKTSITIEGEGAELLPTDEHNLVWRRMRELAEAVSAILPPLAVHIHNGIPLERGLGASGAASLCGLVAANSWLGNRLSKQELLDLAYQLEGHPDNVTPSLLGGCTVSVISNGSVTALPIPFPADIVCVLCIPNVRMPTHEARKVVPATISRADAVFNLSRTALLVASLATGRYDALRDAVQDRLHQPARASVFPQLMPLIEAAQTAGAYGAFLSGAGSTVAAFAHVEHAATIGQAMALTGAQHSLQCRTLVAAINHVGATVFVE